MFNKILIASRGDAALRIVRACKEMAIKVVSVYSTADANLPHLKMSDETVCIGGPLPKDSYLNLPNIMSAAWLTNVDAIHPGIGFLSENDEFARVVETSGLTFIGPSPESIAMMGNKISAKKVAKEMGLNVIEGSDGAVSKTEADFFANKIGYPVLVKAVAGGAGRGIRIAHNRNELISVIENAKSEAKSSFGSDEIYIEKYLPTPRHIEVQIICDKHRNAVHLGERECSIQRKYQKLWEEAPSSKLTPDERKFVCEMARDFAQKMNYVGLGTMEFLYQDGKFYFMEMNTRLQIEHTITEMVTGIDLVKEQIKIAAGEKLSFHQSDVKIDGFAIECRINAENEKFVSSPGLIEEYVVPGGYGIRIDSYAYAGYKVQPYYDSMISKLIAYGKTRSECISRLNRALDEYKISGIDTNILLHKKMISLDEMHNADYNVKSLEKWIETGKI
ncbi:acetyl-CoA carboxylase biotin carboxylase subunit [Candidatus Gromoviella agglomerans]|uniref:acetyl-CoA carboxylase biotin carboxylase subunit n=1 Tax=Candidatus Gromoviella agglomerans TaxID=2806609 RepID=UPI001E2ED4A2|nr:acetyl-CoA carboxylase biotin carboxylase subunit [Candidatus Gromoviella agglomerans]UFX98451.1 Biotin carboxylase [Candidatus Gromoviella agglomerans]